MASRERRTAAYQAVVSGLISAARIDGFMERVAIAKAMDALGVVISDVDPHVVAQAIAFRNGPLLRDHQPIDTYLQRDLEPVTWTFGTEVILELCANAHAVDFIEEAYDRVSERLPTALIGFSEDGWWGKAWVDGDNLAVTLYPNKSYCPDHDTPKPERAPEGQLPTILIEYDWVLGLLDLDTTIELTIIRQAKKLLFLRNPIQYRKLTDSWWANVEVTDIGYLVTFHYSGRFTCDNTL